MAENTKIEWADHSFNPWLGCTKVSPACDHCYAESWAKRAGNPELWQGERRRTKTWGQPLKWNRGAEAAGKRAKVFCASLADVFDNQVPKEWREELFALIAKTPNLDWLLLTKRPQNIAKLWPWEWSAPWPNIWLGTTCENQQELDRRYGWLANTPARVHFISYEPALGPLNILDLYPMPDWIICGGESGANARPMHPQWARSVRDQCQMANAAFFLKQWGTWAPSEVVPLDRKLRAELATVLPDGSVREWDAEYPDARLTHPEMTPMYRVGKKAAGRLLDGRGHSEFPA